MKKKSFAFANLAEWVVILFAVAIIAYISVLVVTYQFNMSNSIPVVGEVVKHLIAIGASLVVSWMLGRMLNPYKKVCKWISIVLPVVVLVGIGLFVFSYVRQTLTLPGSDPLACHVLALQFYESNFGAVLPTGSYLSLWPFQLSFIFILEKTMRIFGETAPLIFQEFNCGYVLLAVAAGYGMVCTMTKRMEGRILYLLLMATYFPLFFNVTLIYGDVPALSWMMLASLCFMVLHRTSKVWLKLLVGLGFAGSSFMACMYKGNCKIFVIAYILIGIVLWAKNKKHMVTAWILVSAIVSLAFSGFPQKYYETYAGNTCGKGVPVISYVAMALQYNGEEAIPGGWNGFHSNTFIATNFDYDETVRISKEALAESLQAFKDDPSFATMFFHTKVLKQWANQTHGIFWGINGNFDVTRDPEAEWVIYLNRGDYLKLNSFIDVHESIVYSILLLAVVLLLVKKIKKETIHLENLLPLATFIGGFFFSLIWEGQTDAVMYYPIMLLPVALGLLFKDSKGN